MGFYAHAPIEIGSTRFNVGDPLPDDLSGLAQLVEHGSAGSAPPVVPVNAGDGATSMETTL